MPVFHIMAIDAGGKQRQHHLEAPTAAEAAQQIRQLGLFPVHIKQSPRRSRVGGFCSYSFGKPRVSGRALMVFTRQLATLIGAGLPLLRSLRTLSAQEKNSALKQSLENLAETVEGGGTFSAALAQQRSLFDNLYVNMVKAGELGGVLEVTLRHLAEFLEKNQKIRGKIQSAMAYPLIVLVMAGLILIFMFLFIVPRFESIFHDMLGNRPLPLLTQLLIDASRLLQQHGWYLLPLLVLGIAGTALGLRTGLGKICWDRGKLHCPVFGNLLGKTAIARFSRTLGTLLACGVPILPALKITGEIADNTVISNAIRRIHDAVKAGESMVGPMQQSALFSGMITSMIQVGEETGRLPEMLTVTADFCEEEITVSVASLTAVLEPLMIVLLALVVGALVLALFLPLLGIITELQSPSGM